MSHSSNSTPDPREPSPSRIVVGIDPGLDRHGVVALRAAGCYLLDRRMIDNSIAGRQECVRLLEQWRKQSGEALTIAIEDAANYGEALASHLTQEGFPLVVVCPFQVARFKEAIAVDANDLVDAEAVARFVIVQPDRARRATPTTDAVRPHASLHLQLRQLSRRHQRWTRERTAACNELHALLRKAWLADYQRFFSHIQGAAALAVWQAYPTPGEAAQADPAQIAKLIRTASHGNVRPEAREKKARDIHGTARVMVFALGKSNPNRWSAWAEDIRMLARHVAHLNDVIEQTDRRMQEILDSIDSPLLSFKGMGPVTAAAIHGETLSLHRFPSASCFARYNGTAPREESSGRNPRFVKNRRCNQRLRQAFMQLALNAVKHQPASKAYQQQLLARGIAGQAARIRLARRRSDIVFAMLRDHRAYDLEYYMTQKQKVA